MARNCIQRLKVAQRGHTEEWHIDVVCAESWLEFPGTASSSDTELARVSCSLVSLVQTPQCAERLSLFVTCMRDVHVRRQSFGGRQAVEDLGESIGQRADDFASYVLLLDDQSPGLNVAQQVVQALRQCKDTTGIIVAVSAWSSRWLQLVGIDGLVMAESGCEASVAAQLSLALSTMTAPHLWSCLDAEDLLPILGSAESPSRLVEATWSPDVCGLVFARELDRQLVMRSPRLAAFIYVDAEEVGTSNELVKAIRRLQSDNAEFVYQVAVSFVVRTSPTPSVVAVTLVCGQT